MKSPKTPSDSELLELARQILELNGRQPNNYDLGESVRRLADLALSNPSLLINNQKDQDPDDSHQTLPKSH